MQKRELSLEKAQVVLFCLYMCGLCAHNSGTFLDTWLHRLLFVLFLLTFFQKQIRIKGMQHFGSYIIFVCYILVACIWAPDISDALNKPYLFGFVQILAIVYILERDVDSLEKAHSYLYATLFALAYTLVILVIKTPAQNWGAVRLGYNMGLNPNALGRYCVVGAILAVFFAETKVAYYLLALIFGGVGLLTGSRKCVFSLIAACGIFFVFKEHGKKRIRNAVILTAGIIVLFIAVFSIEPLYRVVGSRLEVMIKQLMGYKITEEESVSLVQRSFYTEYAIRMFTQRPIFGWGANSFVSEMRRIEYSNIAYCHNNYLELLATLGVVGLCLYYCMQGRILLKGITAKATVYQKEVTLVIALITANLLNEIFSVLFFDRFTQIVIVLMYILLRETLRSEKQSVKEL